jgi:hypothetical protein
MRLFACVKCLLCSTCRVPTPVCMYICMCVCACLHMYVMYYEADTHTHTHPYKHKTHQHLTPPHTTAHIQDHSTRDQLRHHGQQNMHACIHEYIHIVCTPAPHSRPPHHGAYPRSQHTRPIEASDSEADSAEGIASQRTNHARASMLFLVCLDLCREK